MASPQLLSRIPLDAPLFAPIPSDFEGAASNALGDLGSGSDGFDALFSPPASTIDSDIAALRDLDNDLGAADFNEGDFAGVYHAPVDGAMDAFLRAGDAANAAVQAPVTVAQQPTISAPPPPPTPDTPPPDNMPPGGDGGDGGTDPGSCDPASEVTYLNGPICCLPPRVGDFCDYGVYLQMVDEYNFECGSQCGYISPM